MPADQTIEPSAEQRRQAVCAALAGAPGLIRYAARFTRSIEDAEDAYQRSMEIALTRAPVIDAAAFSSWLHVVIKNEATAIAERRRRELPMPDRDLEASVTRDRAAATSDPGAVPGDPRRDVRTHTPTTDLPDAAKRRALATRDRRGHRLLGSQDPSLDHRGQIATPRLGDQDGGGRGVRARG